MSCYLRALALASFLILVSGISFFAGYSANRHAVVAGASNLQDPPQGPIADQFKLFWEAWGWVDREYYDRAALDPVHLTRGAISGMLQTLGDPYTRYLDPERRTVEESGLEGEFEGIGVTVEMKDDKKLRIVSPVPDSPGERAGLRAGDVITHVDGKPIDGFSLADAVALIRGPRGTDVTLAIEREGEPDPIVVTVTREPIKVETVRARMLDQGIAYVRITQFGARSGRELAAALPDLLQQDPKGLILDLRANPGGYLAAAIEVASQFLKDGVVLYESQQQGDPRPYRVRPGGLATSVKMAVLVDGGTASASEIVAGALQDYGRAPLVGEKSYGKGSMQSVHNLADGSAIYVTVARWLTPNQHPINGAGLQPDVEVPAASPDRQPGQDPPLDRAIHIILDDGS